MRIFKLGKSLWSIIGHSLEIENNSTDSIVVNDEPINSGHISLLLLKLSLESFLLNERGYRSEGNDFPNKAREMISENASKIETEFSSQSEIINFLILKSTKLFFQ